MFAGTVISVGVFSHILGVDDAIIGIMSCMSKILSGFLYAFATTTWMIYLAPLVDMVNGTSFIAMRSIASKLVPPDELGKCPGLSSSPKIPPHRRQRVLTRAFLGFQAKSTRWWACARP